MVLALLPRSARFEVEVTEQEDETFIGRTFLAIFMSICFGIGMCLFACVVFSSSMYGVCFSLDSSSCVARVCMYAGEVSALACALGIPSSRRYI